MTQNSNTNTNGEIIKAVIAGVTSLMTIAGALLSKKKN